ncbi:MAG: hypothetical protein ACRETO_08930 [Gammaproteobacteria bacterium]
MSRTFPMMNLLLFGLMAPLVQAASLPAGLDKLAAYAGTWQTESKSFVTAYSKAGQQHATLQNDCWRSGDFYACHQSVDGKSAALVVFLYNIKTDTYITHAIPADGGAASDGILSIKSNTWTFPWQSSEQGKPVYFHVINVFTDRNHIEYRQEFSRDNRHWTVMTKGRDIRMQ